MVVACRTQQIINSSKNIKFTKNFQFNKNTSSFGFRSLFETNTSAFRYQSVYRLCDCRTFHTSKEPRSSLAKLSPQELLTLTSADFLEEECKVKGFSCLDCTRQKYCSKVGGSVLDKSPCYEKMTNFKFNYCDPEINKCVDYIPAKCRTLNPFVCLREDRFPDLQDCSSYVTCRKNETDAMTYEITPCKTTQIYKSSWGKCVFKVAQDSCSNVVCGTATSVHAHHDDSSLYYECKSGKATIQGCADYTETYNPDTKTCNSICNHMTVGLLANPRDCTSYYQCLNETAAFELKKVQCTPGLGYNRISKQCEKSFVGICNELAMLETDVDLLLARFPSFIQSIFNLFKSVFRLFKLSPYTLLLTFGVKPDSFSSSTIIINYVIHNRNIPPALAKSLLEQMLQYLPAPIRSVVELILKIILIIPMNKGLGGRLRRDISHSEDPTTLLVETILANLNIDYEVILDNIQSKTLSQISANLANYLAHALHIPTADLPFIRESLRNALPVAADLINSNVGLPVLNVNVLDGVVSANVGNIQLIFEQFIQRIIDILNQHNYMMGQLFQMIHRRYQQMYYESLNHFLDDVKI